MDAEVLARHLLGWDRAGWLTHMHERPPAGFTEAFDAAVARRARREPVAYITGIREFYGRPFRVTPDVLIPRPETERVVDEALRAIDERRPHVARVRVVDVGTGSGCIAVTLALERPGIEVVATDVSPAALAVARRNAADLGVADVRFVEEPLVGGAIGAYDLVVSNPPYVAEQSRQELMPDVRDYEPPIALFGGPDGLEVLRSLLPRAERALDPGGWLVVEIGSDQDERVRRLAAEATSLSPIGIEPDLACHPRVLVARRGAPPSPRLRIIGR